MRLNRVVSGCLLLGVMVMTLLTDGAATEPATRAASSATEPSGASLAFTTDDPVVGRARGLVAEGRFADAEAVLRESGGAAQARAEMLDVIARIRSAYTLDEPALLKKLRPTIPDVTAADLGRWRAAGQVQFRTIDGRLLYFDREPSNVFRFCGEANRRRGSVGQA